MRAYLPVAWADLHLLREAGQISGPRRAHVVDPQWRTDAPEVDEEEWEFEAQLLAAQQLADLEGGAVLALDLDQKPDGQPAQGWVDVPGPVRRRDVAAVLTEELAWYGAQEIGDLLDRQ